MKERLGQNDKVSQIHKNRANDIVGSLGGHEIEAGISFGERQRPASSASSKLTTESVVDVKGHGIPRLRKKLDKQAR